MSVGCFIDKQPYAISGGYKRYSDPINTCYSKAKAAGNEYFSIQDSTSCFTSSDAGKTYCKYGAGTGCVNGRGGPWRNDIYRLTGNNVLFLMCIPFPFRNAMLPLTFHMCDIGFFEK